MQGQNPQYFKGFKGGCQPARKAVTISSSSVII